MKKGTWNRDLEVAVGDKDDWMRREVKVEKPKRKINEVGGSSK